MSVGVAGAGAVFCVSVWSTSIISMFSSSFVLSVVVDGSMSRIVVAEVGGGVFVITCCSWRSLRAARATASCCRVDCRLSVG
jgi:hypothetical protein